MSFEMGGGDDLQPQPLAEINVIPLVDIMLVLLVIFIVTAPLMTASIVVDMPSSAASSAVPPKALQLSLDADGGLYVDQRKLTVAAWQQLLREQAALTPQPEVHLAADRKTPYEQIARVMGDAQQAGLTRIGLVTRSGS